MKKQFAKADRGEHERIVARGECSSGAPVADVEGASADSSGVATRCPALAKLDDPVVLEHLRAAYLFLGSARLHDCQNRDEEWPMFMGEWPRGGVA